MNILQKSPSNHWFCNLILVSFLHHRDLIVSNLLLMHIIYFFYCRCWFLCKTWPSTCQPPSFEANVKVILVNVKAQVYYRHCKLAELQRGEIVCKLHVLLDSFMYWLKFQGCTDPALKCIPVECYYDLFFETSFQINSFVENILVIRQFQPFSHSHISFSPWMYLP